MDLRAKKRLDLLLGALLLGALRLPVMLLGRFLRRNHEPMVKGDILFIKMQGGGSLVIALPALLGIKIKYPQSRLMLLTTPGVKPFAEVLSVFDEILVLDDSGLLALMRSTLGHLRRALFMDTVIDLEVYSRLTTVLGTCTCARNRIGFYLENTFWRRNLHTHLIFLNRFSGIYHFYDEVARLLGAEPVPMDECRDHLSGALAGSGAQDKKGRRVCIGHACSEMGMERMLSPAQWLNVFRAMDAPETEYVFLGGDSDASGADEIIRLLDSAMPGTRTLNLCGKLTLAQSLAYLHTADEFWGVDSALLHFAQLLCTRSVSFWGPTNPYTRLRSIPWHSSTLYYSAIPCSPCIHVAEDAPCGGRNICIGGLFDADMRPSGDGTLYVQSRFPAQD